MQAENSALSPSAMYNVNDNSIVTKTIILNGGDVEAKRQEILNYFHRSFSLYESLFECLKNDEAYYARANPLRHPLIFYYGHTSAFFINKLNVAKLINERVDPHLESTLAIGVDEMSWDDLNDKSYNWPTPAQVKMHRDKTRLIVDRFIRETDFTLPIDWNSPMWIVLMGIEHERIHLETSSILMRELPLKMLKPHPVWSNICREKGDAPLNELIEVQGGNVHLGKSKNDPLYGWDNEYGEFNTAVSSFKASKYLVSNQEFLEFVKDGGYKHQKYWTEEGWNWVSYRKAEHPVYWIKEQEKYKYRSMLEIIDLPLHWPVEINYLEAKAFCNWKSVKTSKHIRMPTEAEWYKLRENVKTDQPYWDRAPGNINLEYEMSPCPVDRHEFDYGFFDIIGNVWQWTETAIDGYDGFSVHPIYDDFSVPTFDGKHNIFKGGCWISTGNYAIKDSRYAFRRHFLQYSGLRYVEAEELPDIIPKLYETETDVTTAIEAHYGDDYFETPNFPQICAEIVLGAVDSHKIGTERILDIGCGAGRAAYEFAKVFDHVDAIDFSARFISPPTNLQQAGTQRYVLENEGDIFDYKEINLKAFEGYEAVKNKISFMQGDACNLIEKYNDYDVVFAGNLLEELYEPEKFLREIKGRIREGGFLVLASTYTCDLNMTPRDNWLGGFKADTGENFTIFDGITQILTPEFTLIQKTSDIPFVIRQSKHLFKMGISELTVWKK